MMQAEYLTRRFPSEIGSVQSCIPCGKHLDSAPILLRFPAIETA
jgi:hypothetical protein